MFGQEPLTMSGSGDVLTLIHNPLLMIVTPVLAKVLRRFAEEIQETAHLSRDNPRMDSMSRTNPPSVGSYLAS